MESFFGFRPAMVMIHVGILGACYNLGDSQAVGAAFILMTIHGLWSVWK